MLSLESPAAIMSYLSSGWSKTEVPDLLIKIRGEMPDPALNEWLSQAASKIVAVDSSKARPNTLSSRFGLGPQPFHTDFAQQDVPPRRIVLIRQHSVSAKTMFTDLATTFEHSVQEHALFAFQNCSRNNGAVVRFIENGCRRFNPIIMKPLNRDGKFISAALCCKPSHDYVVDWSKVEAVKFNNWSVAHSRGSVPANTIAHRITLD